MTILYQVIVVLALCPTLACRSERSSTPAPPSSSTPLTNASSTTTLSEGPSIVTATDNDKAEILRLYREMYRAMLEGRTDRLDVLTDDTYSLTHMTGRLQPKREWLTAIDSGQMRYHSAEEKSVTIEVTDDAAVLVGKSVVSATIYGARGTWNLQLTTDYSRKGGKWVAMRTVATTF